MREFVHSFDKKMLKPYYLWDFKPSFMRISGLVLFALLISFSIKAQMGFHRAYPLNTDSSIVNITGTQFPSGEFVSLDGYFFTNDSVFESLIITYYDKKGTNTWSRRIRTKTNEVGFATTEGSIFLKNDTIRISATLYKTDGPNKMQFWIGRNGDLLKSTITGIIDATQVAVIGVTKITPSLDSGYIQYSQLGSEDNLLTFLESKSKDGQIIFSKYLTPTFDNMLGSNIVTDVNIGVDSNILLTGLFSEVLSAQITVMDKESGVPLMSKFYSDNESLLPIYQSLSIAQGRDSNIVISGQYVDLNPFDILSSYFGSFIIKVDKRGDIIWAKKISRDSTFANIISNTIVEADNSVVAAGVVVTLDSGIKYFISKFDADGTFKWTKLYNRSDAQFNNLGQLIKADMPGYVYFNTSLEGQVAIGSIIKTDAIGNTTCQDSVNNFYEDANIVVDTIKWKLKDAEDVTEENYAVVYEPFGVIDTKTLALETYKFCPFEPIDWTFNAFVEGATAYKWSNGTTADTLRVFDKEEYSVTVTIGERYCYSLCDTANVSQKMPTTVQAVPFCADGSANAGAAVSSESPPLKYMWNTGATTENIKVLQSGDFIVSVIDACGDTTVAEVEINVPASQLQASIVQDPSQFCISKIIILNAAATATGLSGTPYSYKWSVGGVTEQSISVDKAGTYSVTVTDECGSTASASVNIVLPVLPLPKATITPSDYTSWCINGKSILEASATEGTAPYVYQWQDGSKNQTFDNPTIGQNITLTVTDACGQIATSTLVYNLPAKPTLTAGFTRQCVDSKITLQASGIGGVPDYTFKWSNLETTQSIAVLLGQAYSVTVTDKCGATGIGSITISNEGSVNVEIFQDNNTCEIDQMTLKTAVTGHSEPLVYKWSNNATSSSVTVKEGSYSLTVTDGCGSTGLASYTLDIADPPTVKIEPDYSDFCLENQIKLNAVVSNGQGSPTYAWSTQEVTASIPVTSSGTYMVTVTDNCKRTASSDYAYTAEDQANAADLVPKFQFAQFFWPQSSTSGGSEALPENQVFGAQNIDDKVLVERVQNFEIHVYNRFGNEVFTTTDFTKMWDGTNGTLPTSSTNGIDYSTLNEFDVYVWYCNYNYGNCQISLKGDVTLYR